MTVQKGGWDFTQGTSYQESNADVDQVAEAIATIDVEGGNRMMVEIAVTGQALDTFQITAKSKNGSYQTLYSTAGDFTSPSGILIGTSGDLTAIAAAASGWFIMDVSGLNTVVLNAACVADNGATAVYASIS